jgi:hypothetical protein
MAKTTVLLGLALMTATLQSGLAWGADAAAPVAALVMELSGSTKPPLAVHREVPAGTRITLSPGTRLSLLHYSTCTVVTFSGGTVAVSEQGLEAAATDILSKEPGPCPRTHKIAFAGPAPLGGGIVARGFNHDADYADIASNGLIVITGPHAADAISADILDSNRRPVEGSIPIRDESFRLSGALPPKRPYFVNIRFRGRSEPVEVPISIVASNSKSLLLLQLE